MNYTPRWIVPAILPAAWWHDPAPPYPGAPLPPELERWRVYLADGGHCVLVAVADRYSPGGDPAYYLVPAPVRQIRRLGHRLTPEGFCKADVPYDGDTNGALPADYEH